MITLAPTFTQRFFYWTAWKVMATAKNLAFQSEEDTACYTVWGYDGPEVILTTIWRSDVPPHIVAAGYTQTQNDSDKADFEANYKTNSNRSISAPPAFASKLIGSKRLYKRVHGVTISVQAGENAIVFVIPYNWCKITGIELINGSVSDRSSFYILDTSSGMLSGIPNAPLNQFGFDVNVAKDYYEHKSEFDADLYIAMQLKIVYNSVSSKVIGVNFILNEVK